MQKADMANCEENLMVLLAASNGRDPVTKKTHRQQWCGEGYHL